jgi:hypothetical protein
MQVFTKAWSAALLNALGDILAQKVVDKNDKLDFKRLGIFTFLVSNPLHLPINPTRSAAPPMASFPVVCLVLLAAQHFWKAQGWQTCLESISKKKKDSVLRVGWPAGICHHRPSPALLVPHAQQGQRHRPCRWDSCLCCLCCHRSLPFCLTFFMTLILW